MRISSLTTQTRLPSRPSPWGARDYPQLLIYGWLIACPLCFGGVDLWARAIQWLVVGSTLAYLAWLDPAALRTFRGVMWPVGLFLVWTLLCVIPLPTGLVENLVPARVRGMNDTVLAGQSSVSLSYEPWRTFETFLTIVSTFIAAIFFAHWARHHQGRKRLIWIILVSGLGVMLVAWLNHFTPGHIYSRKIETPGFMGPFTGRNIFADYLVLTSMIGIGFLFQRWWPLRGTSHASRWTLLALGIVVLAVGWIMASASRGACFAWVVGIVVFGALLWIMDPERQRSMGIFIGLFLVAALTAVYAQTLVGRLEQGLPLAAAGRAVTWEQTAKMGSDHWWCGIGLGNFSAVFPRYQPPFKTGWYTHPEDEYLEWWSETGMVGAVLIVIAFCVVGTKLADSRKWKDLEWQAGALAAMAALATHSTVDFPLHIPSNALLAAAILGLIWGNLMRHAEDPAATQSLFRRWAAAGAGLALAILGIFALGAERAAAKGDFAEAIRQWPWEARYRDPVVREHLDRSEFLPAHRVAADGLAMSPCGWRLYYLDGWALAPLSRRTDEARAAFQRAVIWSPAKAETALKAGLFFWPWRPDISVAFWNQSLDHEPDRVRAFDLFLQRTRGVPGQPEFARVLAARNMDRLILLADWVAVSGTREQVLEILNPVLVSPPKDLPSREKLVSLLLKLEQWGQAQDILSRTPEKSARLKYDQARLFQRQEKWRDALNIYHQLAAGIPDNQKMPKLAVLNLETLIRRAESEPNSQEIQSAYAWKLMKAQRWVDADKQWLLVAQRWPAMHEALAFRATCLEEQERLAEACQLWKDYLAEPIQFPQH